MDNNSIYLDEDLENELPAMESMPVEEYNQRFSSLNDTERIASVFRPVESFTPTSRVIVDSEHPTYKPPSNDE